MSYFFNSDQRLYFAGAPSSWGPPFTVVGWFKRRNATALEQHIWSIGVSGSVNNRYTLALRSDHALGGVARTTGGTSAISPNTTTDTASWHHAAYIERAVNDRGVRLDGGTEGTSTDNRLPTGLNEIRLGLGMDGNFDALNLKIAEVAIWSVALSAATLTSLAAGDSPLAYTDGLVSYWPLQNNANDAYSVNHLTVDGATLDSADNPTILQPVSRRRFFLLGVG